MMTTKKSIVTFATTQTDIQTVNEIPSLQTADQQIQTEIAESQAERKVETKTREIQTEFVKMENDEQSLECEEISCQTEPNQDNEESKEMVEKFTISTQTVVEETLRTGCDQASFHIIFQKT